MLINIQKICPFILILFFLLTSIAISNDNSVIVEIDNPKFSEKGLDDKTYEIKAKKGLRSDFALELFTVEGKFKTNNDGKWIYLEADQGKYQQSLNFIELKENISFYTDEGETLKSNYATFDMQKNIIELNDNVRHRNFETLIIADKSIVSNNFNLITYEGNVSTKLIMKD